MKLLVTGGAGFIGSHLAEFYARRGHHVVVFDNLSRTQVLAKNGGDPAYNWRYLAHFSKVKLVEEDIRHFEKVKRAAAGVDAILHTAGQVAVTTSLADPRMDFETNALGTFNLLEAARLNDSALIYTSTNKVYGENVNKIPLNEKETRYEYGDDAFKKGIPETFPIDLTTHTPYGCSKLAGDLYVQDYAFTYGLRTAVFRLSCIYGERQVGVEDQGWLAWFVLATLARKRIIIYGDGKQVRDVLYVGDLARALDAFLNGNLKHEVFNMGGGPENTLSLLELLDSLENNTGKRSNVSFSPWRHADQKVYISDISKAATLLDWKPSVGPEVGVEKLLGWGSEHLGLSS